MIQVARLGDNDRHDLFQNTAEKMGLSNAIVEKDFWVCYILDYIFHRSPWQRAFSFKGGTSLSKAYHLINRFSEDIDLILDWRVLGFEKDEPFVERSKTKQDVFNKDVSTRTEHFLANEFLPRIKTQISDELDIQSQLQVDDHDAQTIQFAYPALFSSKATLPFIRLEIGALAAWSPAKLITISPFAAEHYPHLFDQRETSILTVAAERTFWEKITILHHEANRPEHIPIPSRYARHYYDLYRMLGTKVKEDALDQIDLLRRVVEFKEKFYPRGWARYSDAKPGTLKLVPQESRMNELQRDYVSMQDMLFGVVPSFDQVMEEIRLFEREFNELT